MSGRAPINSFELANPMYKNATVAFYLVANGLKTAVLASLFSGPSGTGALPNPQKLNSRGQFQQPVYIADQVIGEVEGISVPGHDTAIYNPIPAFRITTAGHLEYSFDSGANYTDAGLLSPTGAQSSFISFLHSGGGAYLETVSDILNREVWVESFMSPAQKADRHAGTLLVDQHSAWANAIASFETDMDYPTVSHGGRIHAGFGIDLMSETLVINRNVHILGEGGSIQANSQGSCRMWFPEGVDAVTFPWYTTDPSGSMGTGACIENLFIGCLGGRDTFDLMLSQPHVTINHGVTARTQISLKGVWVQGFSGDAFNFDSVPAASNLNLAYLEKCIGRFNFGRCLFIDGGNGNVIVNIGMNCDRNGLSGIYDSGALGNTHIGAQSNTNGCRGTCSFGGNRYYVISDTLGPATTPGTDPTVWVSMGAGATNTAFPAWSNTATYTRGYQYWSDNPNADTVFLGCYSELGGPPSEIITPAKIIGGAHGAGITPASTGIYIVGSKQSRAQFLSPATASRNWVMNVGIGNTNNSAMNLIASGDDASSGLAPFSWDEPTGNWMTQHNGQVGRIPVRYTTKLNTLTAGRSVALAAGQVMFSQGIFFGGSAASSSTTNSRHLGGGTSTPSSGEVAQGDVWMNTSAAAGGKPGDTCTTGGTAGSTAVYKPWANLGA